MLTNYIKIAYRSLRNSKIITFINISGLTFGITSCLLIILFIGDELSYDKYHNNYENIYRVNEVLKFDGAGEHSASTRNPMSGVLIKDYPHFIKNSVRFFDMQVPSFTIKYEDKIFNETKLFFTDSTVFQTFDFKILKGDPSLALYGPNKVMITRDIAEKYFGDSDPIGKQLLLDNKASLQVTGILENTNPNSHFQYDLLVSFSTTIALQGDQSSRWYWNPYWTYIELKDGVTRENVEAVLPNIVENYFPERIKGISKLEIQPLKDIHLYSSLDYEIEPNSSSVYLYIFSIIAIFILLIASINFMNLSTVRSINRAKEIGMRKVVGALRKQIMNQFLTESILISFTSFVMATMGVYILLPIFNEFTGKLISITTLFNLQTVLILISSSIALGLVSGIYPALYLSKFKPISVIRGSFKNKKNGVLFRKSLVVFQFSISILMIIATLSVYKQLNYMQNKDLGFNRESVILLPIPSSGIVDVYQQFKNRLLQNTEVKYVTATEGKLGLYSQTSNYATKKFNEGVQLSRLMVDFDYMETFGLKLLNGRTFTDKFASDSATGVIINEAALKMFEWDEESAIGKTITTGANGKLVYQVSGVVKDFHYTSLRSDIYPFLFFIPKKRNFDFYMHHVAVKISTENVGNTLQNIEDVWTDYFPGNPFEYTFYNNDLEVLYSFEERLGNVSQLFSVLAIFIACLGLLALSAFSVQEKAKEIGIRKILGSSISGLITKLSREFTILVAVANLIAIPIGYFIVNKWLEGFAYHTIIDYKIYLFAGVSAIVIALVTVSFNTVKASITNPVDNLRSE